MKEISLSGVTGLSKEKEILLRSRKSLAASIKTLLRTTHTRPFETIF